MNESSIIEIVRNAFRGVVAPGAFDFTDDAAMMPPVVGDRSRVITTDVVVEGVDFDRALYPVMYAGYRALAQNISDLSAMGAFPVGFVWSLAIPPAYLGSSLLEEFVKGAAVLARLRKIPIFGGDLSSTTGPFVASITAFGDVDGLPLRRSGARVGDRVYVSAPVGGSAAGLRLLRTRTNKESAFDPWLRELSADNANAVRCHITPQPADGHDIATKATAAIDISDGVALDASRLANASRVRLDLDGFAGAVAPGATFDDAMNGGEDYALLFTAPASARVDGIPVGVVSEGDGVWMAGKRVAPKGFDHFAGAQS